MRKLLHILLFVLLSFIAFSQNIKVDDIKNKGKSRLIGQVTIGSKTFDNSAILTITATDKGLLIPRLTTVERNDISSPTTGLMIYNTTTNQFEFFDGSWNAIGGNGGVADSSFVVLQTDTNKAFNNTNIQFTDSVFFQNPVQIDSPFTVNLAQTTLKGINATSADTALLIQDNVKTDLFAVLNDGYVITSTDAAATFGTRSAGNIAKFSFTAGKNNNATNVGANASSFALGVDNVVAGLFAGALGSANISSGRASLAINESNTASGDMSFAGGSGSVASGDISFAWGRQNVTSGASFAMSFGQDINNTGVSSFVFGAGANGTTGRLVNFGNLSFTVAFDSDIPTFFVGTASGLGTSGNVGIAGITSFGNDAKGILGIGTGIAPITSKADMFQIYSADHSGAGTATIHIRNEQGDIFIYVADGSYVDPTGVSDKSTFATSTVTTQDLAEFVKAMYEALKAQGLLKN